jgi:alanyl-tRNA synthetase
LRVQTLLAERRALEKELSDAKTKLALSGSGGAGAEPELIGDVNFLGQVVEGLDPKELRGLLDKSKARLGSGIAAIVAVNDGRASIGVAVTDDQVDRYNAVDLVRAGVEILGGNGGGGKPGMAQGGGPDGTKADAALEALRSLLAG